MKFTLTLECDNAAFDDDFTAEVARILREAATKLEDHTDARLYDINGNHVGEYSFNTLIQTAARRRRDA